MNLDVARRTINQALLRVDEALERGAFDEWMIISLVGLDRDVLHYSGPRPETARDTFADDLRPLARELLAHANRVGNVHFVPDGDGPAFDVCIRLGVAFYAILNDTKGSTTDLQQLPEWPGAKAELIRLGDLFAADPLAL